MGKIFVRSTATLALCAALAFVEAPAASAARTAHSAKFVGTYTVTVTSSGSTSSGTWMINADGSFTTSTGGFGTWSNKRAKITLIGYAGGSQFKFVGTKTAAGIGTKRNPGTLYVNGTAAGTWYAIKTS